ncbi:hypothetical protein EDB83DRAFT_2322432 [Lactarius deliciosus]|nr:hypothetical protein EDB83DRAFT_2322432 [Lactarius deliciosus]
MPLVHINLPWGIRQHHPQVTIYCDLITLSTDSKKSQALALRWSTHQIFVAHDIAANIAEDRNSKSISAIHVPFAISEQGICQERQDEGTAVASNPHEPAAVLLVLDAHDLVGYRGQLVWEVFWCEAEEGKGSVRDHATRSFVYIPPARASSAPPKEKRCSVMPILADPTSTARDVTGFLPPWKPRSPVWPAGEVWEAPARSTTASRACTALAARPRVQYRPLSARARAGSHHVPHLKRQLEKLEPHACLSWREYEYEHLQCSTKRAKRRESRRTPCWRRVAQRCAADGRKQAQPQGRSAVEDGQARRASGWHADEMGQCEMRETRTHSYGEKVVEECVNNMKYVGVPGAAASSSASEAGSVGADSARIERSVGCRRPQNFRSVTAMRTGGCFRNI